MIGDGDNSEVIINFLTKEKQAIKVSYIVGKRNKKRNFRNAKYLEFSCNFKKFLNDYYFVCTIADNYNRNKIVSDFVKKYKNKIKWINLISIKSEIDNHVKIGEGVIIFPGSKICYKSKIGNFSIINNNSHIEHHNTLKNFSSVGPKVVTGGNVIIGKYSYIGLNSTINNNIELKNNVIVGSKSLVTKDCIQNSIYFGNPAKYIKKHIFGNRYL